MCDAPSAPAPQKIPIHQGTVLPDGGDPSVRASIRGQRKLMRSAMIFSNPSGAVGGTLGAPSVTG